MFCLLKAATSNSQVVFSSSYGVGFNNISFVRGVVMPSGDFLISARPTDTSLVSYSSSILRIDSLGDVLSGTRYEHQGSDMVSSMTMASDGHVYVTAAGSNPVPVSMGFIRKLDADGIPVWSKGFMFDGSGESPIYDLAVLSNGSLAILGLHDTLGVILGGLDSSGSPLWTNRPHIPLEGLTALTLTSRPTGGFYLVGRHSVSQSLHTMFLAFFNNLGELQWAKDFGISDFSEALRCKWDPFGGLVLVGRGGTNGDMLGLVVRTDADGNLVSAFRWGQDIIDAHPFADGSLLLVSSHFSNCVAARISATLQVQWSNALEAGIWGELIPFDEGQRFAYVSSQLFSDVTVHTLSDECETCSPSPGPFDTAYAVTAAENWLVMDQDSFSVTSIDVPIVLNPVLIEPTSICSTQLGTEDHLDNPVERPACIGLTPDQYQPLSSAPTYLTQVADLMGRLCSVGKTTEGVDRFTVSPASPLPTGLYVATWHDNVGAQRTCVFPLSDR